MPGTQIVAVSVDEPTVAKLFHLALHGVVHRYALSPVVVLASGATITFQIDLSGGAPDAISWTTHTGQSGTAGHVA